jgi:molybdopterin synthase catalytic subunit
MQLKVQLFATLRDRAGARVLELDVPTGISVAALKAKVAAEYPNLRQSMDSVLIAVNREYAFDETIIPESAEVAMFPPVSGGALPRSLGGCPLDAITGSAGLHPVK